MKNLLPLSILVCLGACFSGCASTPPVHHGEPVVITVNPAGGSPAMTNTQAVRPNYRQPAQSAQSYQLAETPLPLWRNTEIEEVELEPYVNEKGEMIGRTSKWVVRKQGGWNLDAVKSPERSYIPAENMPAVPSSAPYSHVSLGGTSSAAVAATEGLADGEIIPIWGAIDPKQIRVTAITDRALRADAKAMCRPGETEIWDDDVGQFLIVPQAMRTNAGVTPKKQAAARPANSSATANRDDDVH